MHYSLQNIFLQYNCLTFQKYSMYSHTFNRCTNAYSNDNIFFVVYFLFLIF